MFVILVSQLAVKFIVVWGQLAASKAHPGLLGRRQRPVKYGVVRACTR